MSDQSFDLKGDKRRRLLDILARVKVFSTDNGRKLLLANLPLTLVTTIPQPTEPAIAIAEIVDAVVSWGRQDDGTLYLRILLDNALDYSQGTDAGRDIKRLYEEIIGSLSTTPVISSIQQ